MWNPFDFTGKKILIAGATSGIGAATASLLAKQGAELVLLGRNKTKLDNLIQSIDGDIHKKYIVDFSDSVDYKEIFDDVVSDDRKIEGLIYAPGIVRLLPVNSMKRHVMDETMAINLYAFVDMISILSKKKYHDSASIVGISSIATEYPQKGQGIYAASKSAMNAIVTSLAQELVKKNIRINTVLPGATNTQMYQDSLLDKPNHEIIKMQERQILGVSEPIDIAKVILFLLSDASSVITGRAVYADGGFVNV